MSHAPALGPNGVCYFGTWNNNSPYKFNYKSGDILGSFLANRFVTSTPAILNANAVFFNSDIDTGRLFRLNGGTMDYDRFMPMF